MPVAVVAECHDQQFGTIEYTFDLQLKELVRPLPQRLRSPTPFFVDDVADLPAQHVVGDAQESPGLHEPHTRGRMGSLQEPRQDLLGHHRIGNESPHVSSFADGPVHGCSF